MYKPGQFISIDGKLARVCKQSSLSKNACGECMVTNKWNNRKRKNYCFLNSTECLKKLGYNLYPKLICGNQAK